MKKLVNKILKYNATIITLLTILSLIMFRIGLIIFPVIIIAMIIIIGITSIIINAAKEKNTNIATKNND